MAEIFEGVAQAMGTADGCPTVITYADDFVALCHSREQAETVQARISAWL